MSKSKINIFLPRKKLRNSKKTKKCVYPNPNPNMWHAQGKWGHEHLMRICQTAFRQCWPVWILPNFPKYLEICYVEFIISFRVVAKIWKFFMSPFGGRIIILFIYSKIIHVEMWKIAYHCEIVEIPTVNTLATIPLFYPHLEGKIDLYRSTFNETNKHQTYKDGRGFF